MSDNHHHHSHGHHHDHTHGITSVNTVFIISLALNLGFVVIESIIGFRQHSLSLLSDAGHNMSDVLSLLLVLVSLRLAARHSNSTYTYGYKKSTVLVSLLNAVLLLVAVGAIIVESIHKFADPVSVDGAAISWTAGAGILINGLTAVLLMHGQQRDINIRGAFLHMVADTLVSVGVVVSGIVISLTGWYIIDPIVSMLIAVVILISTWHLLSSSVRLSLDGVPENIDMNKVTETLSRPEEVVEVHHIHVWPISTTETALTAHLVVKDMEKAEPVCSAVRQGLQALGISHATLECEHEGNECTKKECC